jgi:ketosteroid isomerase-like protein
VSRENVEIVRRWLWAFENDTVAFCELAHPDIEWAPYEENHTIFHGLDGAMRIRTEWLSAWDEHRIDLEETLDGGDDVVAAVHLTGRGRGSGVQVDVRLYLHIKLRDGKAIYVFEYQDRSEAVKAAGVEG